MSRDVFRLGLVGCGRLAEAGYLPALSRCPEVQLVAVADPDPTRRAHLAGARSAVDAYEDAATLIAQGRPDGVVLASPAATHLADATVATEAGVAVLVEKPPAPDLSGASALASLRPAPWVGFNRRFDAGARSVRAVARGTTGLSLHLELRYRRRSWGAHVVHDDVLADLGPHMVDWARWISGAEATEVTARAVGPDRARLQLDLQGSTATIIAAADRIHAERIEVRDRSSAVLARHGTGGFVGAIRGRVRRGPHPLESSLAAQLEAFVRAARGDHETDLGSAADGRAAMAVIEAARGSARQGGRTISVRQPVEP